MGSGALAAGEALDAPLEPQVVGGNTPVNESAGDLADIDAHNSPVVARNPVDGANVVAANRVDLQDFSCAVHVSHDGGGSWAGHRSLPVPEGGGDHCYAPDIAFGPDGRLYVAYVTLAGRSNTPKAVWLATSDDGGDSFSEPSRIGDELSFQVRLRADPEEPGRLFLTWLDAADTGTLSFPEPGQPILSAVSGDGGESWSEPVQVNPDGRERVVAPSPAVGPEGDWHVAYLDVGDDRLDYHGAHEGRGGPPYQGSWELVMARSGDGGRTWSETTVDEVVPTERFLVFLPPFPAVAVDPHGEGVYAAFTGGRAADDPQAGADVFLWASPGSGDDWGDAVRVNDTARGDGTRQYLPQIDVASTGRVDVVYYDRREDPDNVANEVSLQASQDGGATFTDRLVISDEPFDSRVGFGAFRDMADLGSRLALVSTRDRALAVWTDTRAGTEVSGKQDLSQAIVAFAGGPAWPGAALVAVRLGGGALVVLGVALVTAWLVGRRSAGVTDTLGEVEEASR